MEVEIDNLKFDHNPVNLDLQKSKANVARHLRNRRPPTRRKTPRINHEDTVFTPLPITNYNFHQVAEENKDKMNNDIGKSMHNSNTKISSFNSSVITSNENLPFTSLLDGEKADEKDSSYPWMRSSLVRRSYQYPPSSRYKTKMANSAEHVPRNKSDLENVLGKFLRHRPDFELWSSSKTPSSVELPKPIPLLRKKPVATGADFESLSSSKTPSSVELPKPIPLLRKKPFVTEATLRETKQKLRHLTNDETPVWRHSLETVDDGVFTTRSNKSYLDKRNEKINSSENLDKMVIKSTPSKCLDFPLVKYKSDDWFDRRKTYGFESVDQPTNIASSSLNSISKTNSSTDSGATMVKFTESQDVIKKGKVLEAIKNFEKNGIDRKTSELNSLTKSASYFLEDLDENQSQLAVELDFLAKRHSIAWDDTKYLDSRLTIPVPSFSKKAPSPGKGAMVVNVNSFESSNVSSYFTNTDPTEKSKEVEFNRMETEVHSAAIEPDKIITSSVETDEKPAPTNPYRRKKRSVSVSPKRGLPQTRFSVFENLTNPENSPNHNLNEDSPGFRSHFTSALSDNGLAVTMASTKPADYTRRASWSDSENRASYSAEINFDQEGVTLVDDAKSPLHENKTEIQDEIPEKGYSNPLKNDEDEFKITANVTDIKNPKIDSEATIKLNDNTPETENSSTNSKKTTTSLNKSPEIEAVLNNATANVVDYREPKHRNHLIKANDIELIEKVPRNEIEKNPYPVRKYSDRESTKHRRKISSKDSIVHHDSMRKSTKSVNTKEKLPESGRDGWLNLPKERKLLSEKRPIEMGKHEIYRKPHIDHVKKDRRPRSGINGCGDISSSEEDSTKKNTKVYIPLGIIREKSKITKTSKLPVTKIIASSSSTGTGSSFEFKNPVLKTEERSRRRAARVLQQASSREMLTSSNIARSSDYMTIENDRHYSRISKPRCTSIRESKSSPKTTRSISTTSNLPSKKTVNSSAKMQVNTSNMKDRMNRETRSTRAHNTSSKSSNYCINDVKSSRYGPQTSQQKPYVSVPEKSRPKPVSCSNRDTKNLSSSTVKLTRPIR